jgi:hypothetical protein
MDFQQLHRWFSEDTLCLSNRNYEMQITGPYYEREMGWIYCSVQQTTHAGREPYSHDGSSFVFIFLQKVVYKS